MGRLLEALRAKRVLVSDGAWGTQLQARGLGPGACPEAWNLEHPEAVREIAAAYAAAGSDLVLTNSFGSSRLKLSAYGLAERTREINAAAARCSVEGAPHAVVAASVGPSGEFVEPYGDLEPEELEAIFSEQIAGLLEGGAHALCIETMTCLSEAACAIRAAKKLNPGCDVIATMTFDATAQGYRTLMGISPEQAVDGLMEAGADVVGANCGNGIAQMVEIVTQMRRRHASVPLLTHANAGLPEVVEGKTVFRQTPEAMAAHVPALLAAGVSILGGCCGTTPEHIRALRAAIG